MGFKSITTYNEEKYKGLFVLPNDRDSADVIFLYRSVDDVLVAEGVHYIKTNSYSGYVHCPGANCPACRNKWSRDSKIFIPVYDIARKELLFWDRGIRFQNKLQQDVFSKFPNPSEFVWTITRHGAAGDTNTTYEIRAVGKNSVISYDDIMKKFNTKSPDMYENICKDVTAQELETMINADQPDSASLVDYQVTPRVVPTPVSAPTPSVELPEYQSGGFVSETPNDLPNVTGAVTDEGGSDDEVDNVDF